LLEANNSEVIAFLRKSISLFENASGIKVAIYIDNGGIMFYEVIIPIETFYKKALDTAYYNVVFNYKI